jgi:predicted transcriptional regulator
LKAGSRRRKISKVRARLIEKLVDEFGFSLVETGRQLGVSSSAVAKVLSRKNNKNC